MTAEQLVALIGAFTALLVAVGGLYRELRSLKTHVNSRMDQLVDLTAKASHAEGALSPQSGHA